MKAIVLHHPGDASALSYEDVPTPTVKPGWSLLKIKGFGINRSEIFTRNGWSPSVHLPRILGIEGVGVIADTTDPARLPVGRRAISLMGGLGREFDGSYAEYALIPNAQLYPVTTKLSWAELAAVPETWFTAYGSLVNLRLTAQDDLLIRGATSGVGVAAAKLATALGVHEVIGSTRNLAKTAQLQTVGVTSVVADVAGKLQAKAPIADKILELVGPATLTDSLRVLRPGGICCVTGELGGVWSADFDPISALPTGGYLTAFRSEGVSEAKVQDLLALIDAHHLDVAPRKTFTLADTAAAQAALDAPDSFGKVVVLV